MPELPEVESIRLALMPDLVGTRIARMAVRRRDMVVDADGESIEPSTARRLVEGQTIVDLRRRGKQLVILTDGGSVMRVHLGMTGALLLESGRPAERVERHVHVVWDLGREGPPTRLMFRDSRRFGEIRLFRAWEEVLQDWSRLGPDALTIAAEDLIARCAQSRRAIKAALLDQSRIAGVGNIYADESLFQAGIHPMTPCRELTEARWRRLADSIGSVLREAIKGGGSTIDSYRLPNASIGNYQVSHRVYGRGGERCLHCAGVVMSIRIAQRSTCFCAGCQALA